MTEEAKRVVPKELIDSLLAGYKKPVDPLECQLVTHQRRLMATISSSVKRVSDILCKRTPFTQNI